MVDSWHPSIERLLGERGWSRRKAIILLWLLLPIWFPLIQALVAYAERRLTGNDNLRNWGFEHGYSFLYGLPLLVAFGIVFFGRMSLTLRFYAAVLYALLGTMIGWVSVELFEGLFRW